MPFRGLEAENEHHAAVEHAKERDNDNENGCNHHNRDGDERQELRCLNGNMFNELIVDKAVAKELATPPE